MPVPPLPTTILLDVDGVLNPFGRYFNPAREAAGYERHELLGYRVWLNPNVGAALLDLVDEFSVQILWATTWNQQANEMISPLAGLPTDLPVLELPDINSVDRPVDRRSTWKLPAIASWAGQHPDHRIVWLDDELERDARDWAKARGNSMLIKPSHNHGLTQKHLTEIRNFLSTEPAPA